VHSLVNLPSRPPSLYIDLEGINLSRKGPISIMQILVLPENQTYLIDIHKLGSEAFSTPGKSGETLKGILESKSIPKVFFDVRNDSAALFSHFQIDLAGIHDLQLMELATRSFSKRCLKGLTKCIEGDLSLTSAEIKVCKEIKEKGLSLFAPERGGSYEVFNVRPLDNEMRLYCIQDVQFMPQLWSCYHSRMKVNWEKRVERATNDRVALSQTESYNGQGRHMALAPAGWA
jgi:exonuclease 3'-5' domain-containing protein 1